MLGNHDIVRNGYLVPAPASGHRAPKTLGISGVLGLNKVTGASVLLPVVPSSTGLPSKRGPGLGSFSRADRGIGGVRPVAPPTWLVSNFLVRSMCNLGYKNPC